MPTNMKGARYKHPGGNRRILGGASADEEANELEESGEWEKTYPLDYDAEPEPEEPENGGDENGDNDDQGEDEGEEVQSEDKEKPTKTKRRRKK